LHQVGGDEPDNCGIEPVHRDGDKAERKDHPLVAGEGVLVDKGLNVDGCLSHTAFLAD